MPKRPPMSTSLSWLAKKFQESRCEEASTRLHFRWLTKAQFSSLHAARTVDQKTSALGGSGILSATRDEPKKYSPSHFKPGHWDVICHHGKVSQEHGEHCRGMANIQWFR